MHTPRLHDRRHRRRRRCGSDVVRVRNERLLLSVNRSLPRRTDGALRSARGPTQLADTRACQRGTSEHNGVLPFVAARSLSVTTAAGVDAASVYNPKSIV